MTQESGQQGADAGKNAGGAPTAPNADDLNLVDDSLEDEGKDEAQLWAEIEAEEAAAAAGDPDDDAAKQAAKDSVDEAAEAAAFEKDPNSDGSNDRSDDRSDDPAKNGKADADADDKANAKANAKAGKDQGTSDSGDPWASVNPELRKEFDELKTQNKRLEQSDKSNRGRVSALQKQLDEIAARQSKGADAPEGGKTAVEDLDLDTAEGWKTLKEEYPEIAGPIEKRFKSLEAKAEQVETAVVDARRLDNVKEQTDQLTQLHPDWLKTDVNELESWVDKQPKYVREAYARNAEQIVDAEEAADIIGRFKAFRSENGGSSSEEASSTDSGPGDSSGDDASATADAGGDKGGEAGGNGNQGLSDRRRRQLESAASPGSGGPGTASGIPEDGDPQALWDAFDREEARQAAG